jgi:hypothetical protein
MEKDKRNIWPKVKTICIGSPRALQPCSIAQPYRSGIIVDRTLNIDSIGNLKKNASKTDTAAAWKTFDM